jgi:hypothetical protein
MAQETHITPADFFWNAAAQEAGFSGQFWLDAYNRYLDAVQRDPSQSFDKWEVERTFRVPFESGHVDVLVRMQPDGREHCALRFTVFPAGDGPDPRQLDRWYFYGDEEKETPPILGEGALLDYMNRW